MGFKNTISKLRAAMMARISKNYRYPLYMYFLLTHRCPFSCQYCNVIGSVTEEEELSTAEVTGIIDRMADAGTQKIQFTGGEPMMRKDIAEIVKKSKERNIFTGISTSGYLIPEKINGISGLDIAILSLEGEEELHDNVRGSGSFNTVKQAMEALKGAGIRYWITMVVNKINKRSIDFILNWARKDGFLVNFVVLHSRNENYLSYFDDIETAEIFIPDSEEYKKIVQELIDKKKAGFPVSNTINYLKDLLTWQDYSKQYDAVNKDYRCWAGRLYGVLEPDGMLFPCGMRHSRVTGRSVKHLGFKEAFSGLQKPSCEKCLSACHTEQNLIFSFKLSAIKNWLSVIQ
ncbi:radical SAM protein [Elusimicrobiota bacterium]